MTIVTKEPELPEGGRSQQPTYLLTQPYYPQDDQNDQIDLADYIRVLWRRKFLILLGTLLCALGAFLLGLREADVYQAKATLILQPPRFSTELKPAPLSVETLKTMLESGFIVSKLRSQLLQKNVIQPDTPLEGVEGMLSAEIYAGKERDQPYIPLIDLVVEADSPEKAEVVANTWAEIFVGESAGLAWRGKQGTLDFIESQYPVVKNTVMELESELKEQQDHHDQALLELETSWSSRIVDFSTESERLQKEHEKETERLRLEFINRWKPDLLKAELKIQEAKLIKFEDELLGIEIAIKMKKDTLTQIQKEIQSQPQYLVLSKAITDEALWDKIGSPQAGLPEELNRVKLRSELLNPTYQNLLNRLTTTQIEYDTLVPKSGHLQSELEGIRKAIDQLQGLITKKEIELFALLKDREMELKSLVLNRQAESEILKKTYNNEMTLQKRERDFEVNGLTREKNAALATYGTLAKKYESAQLAEVEEEPDVKIGALAVAPERPMARRTRLNTLIALVVGFMLTVMLAFVLEYAQSISLTDSPEREIEVSPSQTPGLALDSPSATRPKLAGS